MQALEFFCSPHWVSTTHTPVLALLATQEIHGRYYNVYIPPQASIDLALDELYNITSNLENVLP